MKSLQKTLVRAIFSITLFMAVVVPTVHAQANILDSFLSYESTTALATDYDNGEKDLFGFSLGIDAPIVGGVSAEVFFDMDDYFNVTPEGQQGWITTWVMIDGQLLDLSSSDADLGLDANILGMRLGITPTSADPDIAATIGLGNATALFSGSALRFSSDGENSAWTIDPSVTLGTGSFDVNLISGERQLAKFEIQRSVLDSMLLQLTSAATPGIMDVDNIIPSLYTDVQDMLNQGSGIRNPATFDDGVVVSTCTISPEAGPNGIIFPNSSISVNTGSSFTFTATPSDGYTVNDWFVNGSVAQSGGNNFTLSNIDASTSVQVLFSPVQVMSVSDGSLQVNLTPTPAVAAGSQWQFVGGSYQNSGLLVQGFPPGQYQLSFKPVSGYETPPNQTVTIFSGQTTTLDVAYASTAVSNYILTLTTIGTQGFITPNPTGNFNGTTYVYPAGSTVELIPSPEYGYHFTGWSGDLTGTAIPATVTMSGNKNVTANFAAGDSRLGTATVTIQPPAAAVAGVQWGWNPSDFRASGTSYSTFPGTYYIVTHPVDGWVNPNGTNLLTVTLTAGQTTNYTVTFSPDTTPGTLAVTLAPQAAVTAGAKWHVNGGTAQGTGATASLPPGTNYTITYDSVPGWTAPPSQTVTVLRGQSTVVSANYTPPVGQPVIGAISPPIGAMTGGTQLTIAGVNFTAPATVTVGGQSATNVTVVSPTQITCTAPASLTYGTVPVVIQVGGGSVTNPNGFAYGMTSGSKLDLVGSVGGSAFGVAVQGNYAYVGEGRSLLVLDVSTPSNPSRVGRVVLPGIIQDVALFGQHAYVADGDGGIQVVDISNPAVPAICGLAPTTGWTQGITIFGGRAYVADETNGFEIYDLSNPTSPALLSTVNCTGYAGHSVVKAFASGAVAYLTTGGNLYVIDVSQPLQPAVLGQTAISGGGVYAIAMSGNFIFGASIFDASIHMIDVSNPAAPADSKPSAGASGNYYTVAVANNTLYAESSVSSTGFVVFGINGNSLTKEGQMTNLSSGAYHMAVQGTRVYIAGRDAGVKIVDVTNAFGPASLASFTDAGSYEYVWAAAVTGNTLCTSDGSNLNLFDVSQLGQPLRVASLGGIGFSQTILASNGIAYLRGNGTEIVRISTPTSPQLIATIPSATITNYKMALVGNMLYIVGQNQSAQPRFVAYDVTNPASPILRGTKDFTEYAPGSYAESVAVNGNKALVGIETNLGQGKMCVLDISNLSAPVEDATLANIAPSDIRISPDGSFAYVPDSSSANVVDVISIGNPSTPSIASTLPLDPTSPQGVEVVGNELFATTLRNVFVFDITAPGTPLLTRTYTTSNSINGMAVPNDSTAQSGMVYLSDGDGGVMVLKEEDIQAPDIYITNPSFSSTYTTTNSNLSLGGGSDDNVGVTRVTWSNDRGGGGDVAGPFDSWFVGGITLQPGANVLTVQAYDQAGNSGTDTLTVTYQAPVQAQSITFPAVPDQLFGTTPISVAAAANSGLPVSFSVVSGPATISNNILTLTGAGTVVVQAAQTGNSFFNAAPVVDLSFNVAKADQVIAFPAVADRSAGNAPFAVTATASSGLPVTFSIVSGPAVINGSTITLTGAGTVTVRASQSGDANFNAAADVVQSFVAGQLSQALAFGPLSQQMFGDAPFVLNAVSSAGLPVTYSSSNPSVAMISNDVVVIVGAGTTTITASQAGDPNWQAAADVAQTLTVTPPSLSPTLVTLATNQTVVVGQSASFTMAAVGTPAPSYQWQRLLAGGSTWTNLSDDGTYGGTATPTLTVGEAGLSASGDQFRVIVTNNAGSYTSPPAALAIQTQFQAWQAQYFNSADALNPAVSGPLVVLGPDATTNLVKYALGVAPTQALPPGGLVPAQSGTTQTLTFRRPANRADIAYLVEVSIDLQTWTSTGVTLQRTLPADPNGFETWVGSYTASGSRTFFRLRVTQP